MHGIQMKHNKDMTKTTFIQNNRRSIPRPNTGLTHLFYLLLFLFLNPYYSLLFSFKHYLLIQNIFENCLNIKHHHIQNDAFLNFCVIYVLVFFFFMNIDS